MTTMTGRVAGVGSSDCVGGVLDANNQICYTYHGAVKTRQDAADACHAAASQLVSVEVTILKFGQPLRYIRKLTDCLSIG